MNSRAGRHIRTRLLPVLVLLGIVTPPALSQTSLAGKAVVRVTLRDVTSRLHLTTSLSATMLDPAADKSVSAGPDSLEFTRRKLISMMGGSVAAADVEHDGLVDLYVVFPGASNRLFRGLKDGTFIDVTAKAGLAGTGTDLSAAFADYDHSGRASLFVAGLGGVRVYHNNGDGTFTEVTDKTGLKGKPGELATSVLLFDADGDGFLDVLVTVYADLSAASPKASFPRDFPGASSRLYRNKHDQTFRDVTEGSGLADNPGRTRRALAADFSQTGRADLLLLRDNKPPALYRNLGDCKFEEETWEAGPENWKFAYIDGEAADFDGDGKADLVLWSTIGNEVLINLGGGKFEPDVHLPLVYAPNRTFGFHGIVADLLGETSKDLLIADSRDHLHVMANHKGHFSEVSVSVAGDGKPQNDVQKRLVGDLSSLLAVRPRKGGPLLLIGVDMRGQVIALESSLSRRESAGAHAGKGK